MNNIKKLFLWVMACTFMLTLSGFTSAAQITLSMKNKPVKEVIKEIEKNSDYRFFYNDDLSGLNTLVSMDVKDGKINQVMDLISSQAAIAYVLKENNQIVLATIMEKQQQGNVVSGVVIDTNGEPILGANVVEKGTTNGNITDVNGKFSLSVGEKAVLRVSYLGYVTQEITVGNQTNLNITLQEDSQVLDEVIIVGYGTQKKVNLSGAVSTINAKTLENRPVTNVNQALQGLAPGMNIQVTDGRSTNAPSINVRGYTSINGGSAFVLVDNVPVTSEELSRINPLDIENVSILKDAAASAIYGARAAFGVVLITTKTAKSEKLAIDFDANYGSRQTLGLPDLVSDPYNFMYWSNQANMVGGTGGALHQDYQVEYAKRVLNDPSLPTLIDDPVSPGKWGYYSSTDWVKETYSTSTSNYNANLRIAQKGPRLSYVISGGYNQQDGILQVGNDVLKRYNFRGNGAYKLTDRWEIGSIISFAHSDFDAPSMLVQASSGGSLVMDRLQTADSFYPLKNPDGTWTSHGANLTGLLQEGGRSKNRVNETQISLNTTVDILKEVWTLKGDANFRFANTQQDKAVLPVFYREGPNLALSGPRSIDGTTPYADLYATENHYSVLNLYTDFHKTFAEKHFLQAMVGFNQEYLYNNYFTTRRMGLISNNLPTVQLATGTVTSGQTINDLALRGFFYRLNYIFDNKYIVEVNARNDGTSRYPSDSRWGFFPSGSLGWVLSNEKFMAGVNEALKLNTLKLRGSYGELGNQVMMDANGVSNYYPYLATMASQTISAVLDGTQPLAINQPGTVAGNMTWERVRTINGGIDLALLNNKIELSFDKYTRYTEGMLTQLKSMPGVYGAAPPSTNAADLKTNGWELTVGYRDQVKVGGSPLSFGARFMLWDARTYITKYDNPNRNLTDHYVGEEIGEIWGLTNDGRFTTQAEVDAWGPKQVEVGTAAVGYLYGVGDSKWKDLNGDGYVTLGAGTVDDPGDRKIIGNNTARLLYSFEGTADWKGFDLRFFLQGVGKRDWYPGNQHQQFWGMYATLWITPTWTHIDNQWTPENPDSYFPRLKQNVADPNSGELRHPQTQYLQDLSYLRLKNLTIGYTLPRQLTQKADISRLRIYFSGENLWTLNHIFVKAIDPETASDDSRYYPMQRVFSMGLNLSF